MLPPKKGCGRVIMVSDFILESTGILEKDDGGKVIERARRFICPGGARGDNETTGGRRRPL